MDYMEECYISTWDKKIFELVKFEIIKDWIAWGMVMAANKKVFLTNVYTPNDIAGKQDFGDNC